MKILVVVMFIIALTSCNPEGLASGDDLPLPPTIDNPDNPNPSEKSTMKIIIGSRSFTATLLSSATATAFKAMLPMTLRMNDFNNNEKVASLPSSLPTNSVNIGRISNGDIMLYGSGSLVLFYESFSTSYSYTRIGVVDNPLGFKDALRGDVVSVKFEIE